MMSHEPETQAQDHSSGYADQTMNQKSEAPGEAEHQRRYYPINGYAFCLEVLKWVEDNNWPFVLIFGGTVLLPLLIELLHLLSHIMTGK